jgi:hypothetical protein
MCRCVDVDAPRRAQALVSYRAASFVSLTDHVIPTSTRASHWISGARLRLCLASLPATRNANLCQKVPRNQIAIEEAIDGGFCSFPASAEHISYTRLAGKTAVTGGVVSSHPTSFTRQLRPPRGLHVKVSFGLSLRESAKIAVRGPHEEYVCVGFSAQYRRLGLCLESVCDNQNT